MLRYTYGAMQELYRGVFSDWIEGLDCTATLRKRDCATLHLGLGYAVGNSETEPV